MTVRSSSEGSGLRLFSADCRTSKDLEKKLVNQGEIEGLHVFTSCLHRDIKSDTVAEM